MQRSCGGRAQGCSGTKRGHCACCGHIPVSPQGTLDNRQLCNLTQCDSVSCTVLPSKCFSDPGLSACLHPAFNHKVLLSLNSAPFPLPHGRSQASVAKPRELSFGESCAKEEWARREEASHKFPASCHWAALCLLSEAIKLYQSKSCCPSGRPRRIRVHQGAGPPCLHHLPGCPTPGFIHLACLPQRLRTAHHLPRAEHFTV